MCSEIRHKEFFYIFDWCRNFEFFNQHTDVTDGASANTLAKRLFAARVELVGEVNGRLSDLLPTEGYVQKFTSDAQAAAGGRIVHGCEVQRAQSNCIGCASLLRHGWENAVELHRLDVNGTRLRLSGHCARLVQPSRAPTSPGPPS